MCFALGRGSVFFLKLSYKESGGGRIKCSVLFAVVKSSVFKSYWLGPKFARGFGWCGICDSWTGKCWRFAFTGLPLRTGELRCIVSVQLKTIEKF